MTAPRSKHVRRLLLTGAALCGLAIAGPGGKARAQAFDGTPATVTGSVSYDRATPGVETITVNSNQAVILWTPPPSPLNPYVFLPAGNVATFQNGPGNTDFAVLNRIAFTSGPTRFDGSVISQLIDGLGTATRGGTILFQSPGGIIIGSAARFDVGNLVLTTLDVATNAAGDFFDPTGLLSLNSGGAFPNALIQVEPGAQILAPAEGSYVILAAPRIDQGGLVRVNGSVGYIAGETIDLRVNAGLFDIIVNVGTDNATPIIHSGTTGGPASTGAGDVHRIYMVAAPSNQAITSSLLGNIGFDDAVSATVENGQIILSGGYQIFGGDVVVAPPPAGTPAANFQIPEGRISSDLFGFATGNMFAGGSPNPLDFTQDVTLFAALEARLFADQGQAVTVGGDASVSSPGGQAGIVANSGGSVAIAGNALVDASATGGVDLLGDGTDAQGGQAQITADGGTITINGNADVRAAATGGSAPGPIGRGGNGNGGNAGVLAQNNGAIRVDGNLSMDAGGQGGFTPGLDSGFLPVDGGNGSGGVIQLAGSLGNVSIGGATRLAANGVGGASASTTGGTGTGGNITIRGSDGATSLAGQTIINARGTGGFGFTGGAGQGGGLFVGALRGSVTFASAAAANLSGTGGDGGLGGLGGNGSGGNLIVFADSATASVTAPSFDGNVDGIGGVGGASDGPGGLGGNGQGGNATLIAQTDFAPPVPALGVRIGTVNLSANGQGGSGGDSFNATGGAGGSGAGGVVSLRGEFGRVAVLATATLTVNGTGAAGGAGGGGGAAGTGAGGNVTLLASGAGALVSAPTLNGSAGGLGPALAGNATGNWDVSAAAGGAMNFTTLTLAATVAGTNGGGQASVINVGNGRLDVTGAGTFSTPLDIQISAAGTGTLAGGDLGFTANQITVSHLNRPANVDTISGANLAAQTVADFVANAGTSIRAATAINLTAGGTASFAGLAAAPTMTIRSSNIDIAAGALLGDASTQTINLIAAAPAGVPFGQVVIGGGAQGPGYTLTNSEAGRIRTATLNIQTAPTGTLPGRPPDLLLRDLTLIGSGGGVNVLRITAAGGTFGIDGIAQVEGNVLLANAGAGDGIFLTAAQRLQVVNPQGSIRVLDAAGLPGGTLTLTSNNIWSASQALISQLLADVNFAGRNDALLANGGADAPRGYIEAADVTLAARDTLLVQNSGTATDFAGITVVLGTLVITPTGAPLDVYAFGRRINPDGSFAINKVFFREVVFGGPGVALSTLYPPDAAFNNCPIVGALCRIPENPLPGGPDPIVGPTGGSGAIILPPPPGDDLVDTSFSNDPLIEEPVTSGSENILWDCRDENRDGKCDGRHE